MSVKGPNTQREMNEFEQEVLDGGLWSAATSNQKVEDIDWLGII